MSTDLPVNLAPEDLARRQRLEAAMSTPAARWCADQAERLREGIESVTGEDRPLWRTAGDAADSNAASYMRSVYEENENPHGKAMERLYLEYCALDAWAHLVPFTHEPDPLTSGLDRHLEHLEDANYDFHDDHPDLWDREDNSNDPGPIAA